MSEPLSAERFEQFIETYTHNHADHTQRLDRIEDQLAKLSDVDALRQTVLDLQNRVATLESIRSR